LRETEEKQRVSEREMNKLFKREDEGKAKAPYWRKQRGIQHYIGTGSLSLSKKGIYFRILTHIFYLLSFLK